MIFPQEGKQQEQVEVCNKNKKFAKSKFAQKPDKSYSTWTAMNPAKRFPSPQIRRMTSEPLKRAPNLCITGSEPLLRLRLLVLTFYLTFVAW